MKRETQSHRGAAFWLVALGVVASAAGCADGKSGSGTRAPAAALTMTLSFERTDTLDFFAVAAVRDGADGVPGLSVTFASSAGVLPEATGEESSPGVYRARVNATGTGEVRVNATVAEHQGLSATGTALVFAEVGGGWDQPVRVEGLVNTAGWEDGIFITRDAEVLFVQYIPVSVSCFFGNSDACGIAVGPVDAPERPAMIGSERIDAGGHVTNTCFGLTPEQLSVNLPPCNYYGFRRQKDGSYAEPFRLGFDNSGGCLCPVGLSAYPHDDGTATVLFSFDDPQSYGPSDTGSEFVVADITLGADSSMGTWTGTFGSGAIEDAIYAVLPIPHDPLALGVNPYGLLDGPNAFSQIWFDNEYVPANNGIWVTHKQPDGTWQAPTLVGAPVSLDGVDERMPFFDESKLLVRRDNTIATMAWNGGDWADDYHNALVPSSTATTGAIVLVGEPTLSLDPETGRDLMFFNYGVWLADGTVDLNVGMVRARP